MGKGYKNQRREKGKNGNIRKNRPREKRKQPNVEEPEENLSKVQSG